MIREMTGMLVTAMARANTRVNTRVKLNWSAAGPRKRLVSYTATKASSARNGTTLPATAMPSTLWRSAHPSSDRSSAPEQNISSSRPSW